MQILLFVLLFAMMFLGIPIAFAILASCAIYIMATDLSPIVIVGQRLINSVDSFSLLCSPLFILAGYLMEEAGISKRLVNCAQSVFGRFTGGIGAVAIVCCMVFAALTGSGPATVAAIGSIMFPYMVESGYDRGTASGLLAASGALGPIIPPSVAMIVYATTMGLSITDMFMGAVIPGFVITACYMVANYIIAKKRHYAKDTRKYSIKEILSLTWKSMGALMMPVVVLGGIYGGIFTATEASGIAVAYALILGFYYRTLTLEKLKRLIVRSAETTGVGLFILSTAGLFVWLLSKIQLPKAISNALVPLLKTPAMYMFVLIIILLIAGTLMETIANISIFAPLLVPTGVALGIDELYLGVVVCVTLIIGFFTPPFGVNLFQAVSVTETPYNETVKGVWPFVFAALIALTIIVLFPATITWLPSMMAK